MISAAIGRIIAARLEEDMTGKIVNIDFTLEAFILLCTGDWFARNGEIFYLD